MAMDAWKWGMWGWVLLSGPVPAQEVHRCTRGTEIVYQAAPCGAGQVQKRWPRVHPPPAARPLPGKVGPAKSSRRVPTARRARMKQASGATIGLGHEAGAGCEQVKARRAAAYAAAGLKRNFALSSLWDNRVQQACK